MFFAECTACIPSFPSLKQTSAFQKAVRGEAGTPLYDHISKNMNELNLERCRCIPKGVPGADWRVLEEIVKNDPSREKFNVGPFTEGDCCCPYRLVCLGVACVCERKARITSNCGHNPNIPVSQRYRSQGQPLVPWCLPNTADRHNGWRGLFGRLDPQGHFPTSTTDPQPMGKVGQVFHPDQDRIVSVRECARAQGEWKAFEESAQC